MSNTKTQNSRFREFDRSEKVTHERRREEARKAREKQREIDRESERERERERGRNDRTKKIIIERRWEFVFHSFATS